MAAPVVVELAATRDDAQKKGSWRLSEVGGDPQDPKLGDVYVPKTTLMLVGWEPGKKLVLTIDVDA
jgi:hypothetical protein